MRGPLFVSVGKAAQLDEFIKLNPELRGAPELMALIDDSAGFDAYRAAGFNYNMVRVPVGTHATSHLGALCPPQTDSALAECRATRSSPGRRR